MMDVKVFKGLDSLPDNHRELLGKGLATSFFCSLAWYDNLAKTATRPDRQLLLYSVEEAGQVRLIMPMRTFSTKSATKPDALKSFSNFYSPVFMPTLGSVESGTVQKALKTICLHWRSEKWYLIDLEPLVQHDSLFEQLKLALQSVQLSTWSYYRFGNWYLDSKGLSSESYLALLPKKLRHTIRRTPQKIEEQHRLDTRIYTDLDGNNAIEAFLEVYDDSWHEAEPYPSFLPGLIEAAARERSLRLGVLYLDGEPAAAQLWFVAAGVASIFKVAYKDRFSQYSPGSLLTMEMLRHVLDKDRVEEVDFLSGDDEYKRSWMSHRRERWGLRAYNPRTIKGLAGLLLEHANAMYKKVLGKKEPELDLQSRLKPRQPSHTHS